MTDEKNMAFEKPRDANLLDRIEDQLINLIRNTTHNLAIDELTKALAHVRHSRRAIPKGDVDFYKGLGGYA